nr:response regulator [uncultured Roseovarius sp.]
MPLTDEFSTTAASVRPVLQTLARLIASDRRTVILATAKAEILLSNTAASRLSFTSETILAAFDWPGLCARARRAGSIAASAQINGTDLEGELVHLPLGPTDAYLLRLAETDQEASVLRNRSRTATLLRVSHDLRTPIQSLLSAADAVFAASDADAVTLSNKHDRMRRAAELALNHIDNVIKVIRGEIAPGELQVDEDFNLMQEVRTILDMVEPIVTARGAVLVFPDFSEDEIWVRGPIRFVRALLQNMIDNSAKHGGERIEIALFCQPSEVAAQEIDITVEVTDLGGGLPTAQKTRLLGALESTDMPKAPNQPEEKNVTRPSAGLNVLAHALAQLGGKIEVLDRGLDGQAVRSEAEAVSGTILRAHFSLPSAVSPAELAQVEQTSDKILAGVSILVVEDSPSSRDWLVETLKRVGATVQAVGSGVKALEILRNADTSRHINLLLTDMTLPNMSGVELVRKIREGQASGEIIWRGTILGLTAHVHEQLREACMALGILKVLEKPIRHTQLCQSIRDAVETTVSNLTDANDALPDKHEVTPEKQGVQEAAPPLDTEVVTDLIEQMNLETAKNFMKRALAEAQVALEDIHRRGNHDDTGRMLHAATGACGLTGLNQIERRLRELELALEQPNAKLDAECAALDRAIASTTAAIDQLN